MVRKTLKRFYIYIISWILLSIILIVVNQSSFIKEVENRTLDYRFSNYSLAEQADTNIVLISIDDQSLRYANEKGVFWPWPREFYALATNYLSNCGAEQVIFDIQFNEPDYNRGDIDSEASDNYFANVIKNSGNVILSSQALLGESKIDVETGINTLNIEGINIPLTDNFNQLSLPIKKFRENSLGVGIINISPDDDGVVRRVPLFYKINGQYYPQLAFLSFLKSSQNNTLQYKHQSIATDKIDIPILHEQDYLINWYGNGGVEGVFKYIPYSNLIQSAVATSSDKEAVLNPELFKGKTVIIGATAPGLFDLKTSPVTKVLPGMEIWATIISNLRNGHFIKTVPGHLVNISIILLVALTIISLLHQRAVISHLFLLIEIVVVNMLIIGLWTHYRYLLPWVIYIITIVLTYLTVLLVKYLAEGRDKQKLKKIFTRYIHPDLVNILINNSKDFELGGKEVEATILFTDIYDFTTYSENKTPKELVTELNKYFETITDIILKNQGMLDKFTGDGLMALFGSPLISLDHAYLACKVALEHRSYTESLSPDDDGYYFNKMTRIGINSGLVVVGNIGSSKRTDYTAIGDAVNLSARIEGVNKLFKTSIIIGESTQKLIKDRFICRELDVLKVKGKNEPTKIFELIDELGKKDKDELIASYEEALMLYKQGHFLQAKNKFEDLYNSKYSDYPSQVMASRCQFLIDNPPKNWEGIFTLKVK